jgi:hypothetical protein
MRQPTSSTSAEPASKSTACPNANLTATSNGVGPERPVRGVMASEAIAMR